MFFGFRMEINSGGNCFSKNPDFELFKKDFPEVGKIFGELYQSVSSKALDEKTKQLVYLGVLTANRYGPFACILPRL